ncbi:MAG: hypothetical protein GY716_09875 [bacterium]|nr:hypothetical protein [bacterium]
MRRTEPSFAARVLHLVFGALLVAISCVSTGPALAAEPEVTEPPPAEGESSDDDEQPADPCKLVYEEPPQAIDRVRGIVHRSVCSTALWFDSLFGDPNAFEEAERTYGLVSLGGVWEERESVDAVGRVRIKWRFPAAEERLSLIVGRVPEERIAAEDEDAGGIPAELDEDDQEFIVGIERVQLRRTKHKATIGVGVTYRDSVEPFVKLRWRSRWILSEMHKVKLRLTPYWQDGEREFGARMTVDADTQLHPKLLLRWRATGTHDGRTRGTKFFSGPLLYHQLNDTYFMAHRIGVSGQSDDEVPDRSYGFVSSLRRSILREWLFVELSAGVDWRRETLEVEREPIGRVGILFEMHFGPTR